MEFLKKSLNKVNVQENTLYDIIYDLFFYAKLQESEEDIKNGKSVDISNYVINENKDYTTKLTSDVYSVSLKLEKTIDKIV